MNQTQLAELVAQKVKDKLEDLSRYMVPAGVSNRHVHVTKETFAILFGTDIVFNEEDIGIFQNYSTGIHLLTKCGIDMSA